jgi:hypothetical protein
MDALVCAIQIVVAITVVPLVYGMMTHGKTVS